MATHHIILLLMGLLLSAVLVEPLARRLHLPFTAALVLVGFAGSEAVVALDLDTGLRADSFHDLILYVFLPVLIFESAFQLDARLLWRNLAPILFFAIPVMLLSTMVTAALIYAGIAHPTGFPWIAALLTGALLSATDPVAVVSLFRRMGVPERLGILLEGESLFNDATAIVVFAVFVSLATGSNEMFSAGDAAVQFATVFFGGMGAGLVAGLAFLFLLRGFQDPIVKALLTLVSAYTSFLVAEEGLHVSGVMAVLVTGLILGRGIRADLPDGSNHFVTTFWGLNSWVANALVFLLMGVTVTVGMFEERWLAMLIGIGGVLLARAVGIFAFSPLINQLTPVNRIPLRYQTVMFWGGLRGAVTLALALSLPTTLDYWWTIQSIAFGVVLFTLFVQAPSTALLLRRLGLARDQ